MPTVSVIMPVHNAERYIAAALTSAREQVPAPLDIIVVDDGSTDSSAAAALRAVPEIVLLHQTRRGPAAARNAGAAHARGEVVAFLDADDVWLPGKLELQLEALGSTPDACVITHQLWRLEPGVPRPSWMTASLEAPHPAYFPSAMLMRREVFARVGDFDENLRLGEDFDWLARAADSGVTVVVVPKTLIEKRIHRDNLTHDIRGIRNGVLTALRRSVARKRFTPVG